MPPPSLPPSSPRYGEASARIFRLLRAKGQLEDQSVVDMVLLRKEETRSRLFALQAAHYVKLFEVPTKADRAPKEIIYLWSTMKADRLHFFVAENVAKGLGNLVARRQHVVRAMRGVDNPESIAAFQSQLCRLDYAVLQMEEALAIFVHV